MRCEQTIWHYLDDRIPIEENIDDDNSRIKIPELTSYCRTFLWTIN